ESFIANNKATHRNFVKKAMLMNGLAYIQLGEPDKAIDSFFAFMAEYPKAKDAAEANLSVGYCYILQGKFEMAAEVFEAVVKNYPSSFYASRSQMFITRIKSMNE
ncbi:tol-pal system YbgF family protein, partial [Planctomycetota bacterium]